MTFTDQAEVRPQRQISAALIDGQVVRKALAFSGRRLSRLQSEVAFLHALTARSSHTSSSLKRIVALRTEFDDTHAVFLGVVASLDERRRAHSFVVDLERAFGALALKLQDLPLS